MQIEDVAEAHVEGWRVRVIEWETDETVRAIQCKSEREAEKVESGLNINMASEFYTEVDDKPRTLTYLDPAVENDAIKSEETD